MSNSLADTDQSETIATGRISAWDVCTGIAPAVALSPVMLGQAFELWRTPQTQIGLLIWLVVAVIVGWQARGQVTRHKARIIAAVFFLAGATLIFALAILQWSLNWMQVAASLYLVAWGLGRCSQLRWHQVVAWAVLIVLTLPIYAIYSSFDSWLVDSAAHAASTTLDVHGIANVLSDGQLSLKSGTFDVNSVNIGRLGFYAVFCLSAVWCWAWGRSLFHSVWLVVSAALSLLMARYLGVLTVAIGLQYWQQDWTSAANTRHALGFGVFALTFLLIALFDRLLVAFCRPIPAENPEYGAVVSAATGILMWPNREPEPEGEKDDEQFQKFRQMIEQWRKSWFTFDWRTKPVAKYFVYICGGLSLLAVVPILLAGSQGGLGLRRESAPLVKLETFRTLLNVDTLPEVAQEGKFTRVGFTFDDLPANDGEILPANGIINSRWKYGWEGYEVVVSLHGPESTWRQPLFNSSTRSVLTEAEYRDSRADGNWGWFECKQTNALGGDAYLFQCCLQDDLAPATFSSGLAGDSLGLMQQLNASKLKDHLLYDVRVSCESGTPLKPEQLENLLKFFKDVRKIFAQKLVAGQLLSNQVTE